MNGAPIFDPDTGEIVEAGGDHPPAPDVMSLDDARALLVREHGVAVGNDDPILMAVSLHQGFVGDLQRLLDRHTGQVRSLLDATGNAYAESVEAVLESLKDKTVKASLDHAFGLVERQALAMETLCRTLRRHRLVLAILTALSWAACLLVLAILFFVLR